MRKHDPRFYLAVLCILGIETACSSAPVSTSAEPSISETPNAPGMTETFKVLATIEPLETQENGALQPHPYPYPDPTQQDGPFGPYPDPNYTPPTPIPSITPSPTPTSLPEQIEIHFDDLGLLWRECELPRPQGQTQEDCLGVTMAEKQDGDATPFGETFMPEGGLMPGLRLQIGNDVYEAEHLPYKENGYTGPDGKAEHRLYKNGQLLITLKTPMLGYENAGLLNINGKYAWEFASFSQETVIYDGVDLRQQFGFDAIYRPYVIEDKMIFVASDQGRMFVVVDGEQIGPTFDKIENGYCCETIHIYRLPGQYWFWGDREGRRFVVVITAIE